MCTCITCSSFLMHFSQEDRQAIQSKQEGVLFPQMLHHTTSLEGRPFKKRRFHRLTTPAARQKCARNFSWCRQEGEKPQTFKNITTNCHKEVPITPTGTKVGVRGAGQNTSTSSLFLSHKPREQEGGACYK